MSLRAVAKHLLGAVFGNGCRSFSINLSQEQQLLQKTCRHFAEAELQPIAAQLDKEQKFPADQVAKMGELGLLSVSVPEQWDGSGYDKLALAVAIEEIARGCGGTGAIMSIHNTLYANLIAKFGSKKQKDEYLRPFTKGTLGCFALSEPDAGSDVGAMTASAALDGDTYVLNGTKSWVTSGLEAKAAIIFATVDKSLKYKGITGFLAPLPSPGLILGANEDKMGIRASSTCSFTLEDLRLPKENIIGEVGGGFKMAMMQLDEARIGIAAQALGIAQAALETAVSYAAQRKTFGKTINKHQAVKLKIANMAQALESARLLVWRAATLCDLQQRSTKESSMAKLAASEAATFVAHSAVQILGGMGYVSDLPAERHYRDARITEIYGGISDIQRFIIADDIIKQYEK